MHSGKTGLVLGATGGIGGAVAQALQRRGWRVKALVRDLRAAETKHRDQAIDWIEGDAMCRADVIGAAAGVDAIVHAVNPSGYRNWDRVVLPMIENTIAGAEAAGGVRIVLPGTIYNFDPAKTPLINEDTPQLPRSKKGVIRVLLEQRLEAVSPRTPSLIVRAGDFYGPGVRASWFAQALVKPGRPVARLVNPGKGVGHSWAYLPDLAQAIAHLMDLGDRLGPFERLQFQGHWDPDGTAMPAALRQVIGRDVPERMFPWWLMRALAPLGGFPREAVEIQPYWSHPVQLDNGRLRELLGAEPRTSIDEAVRISLIALDCLPHPGTAMRQQLA